MIIFTGKSDSCKMNENKKEMTIDEDIKLNLFDHTITQLCEGREN